MFGRKARLIRAQRLALELERSVSARLRERVTRGEAREQALLGVLAEHKRAAAAAPDGAEAYASRYARLAREYLTWRWRARERERVLRSVESYLLEQADRKKGNAALLERVRTALLLGLVVVLGACTPDPRPHWRAFIPGALVVSWCFGRARIIAVYPDDGGMVERRIKNGCAGGQEV